MLNNEQKKQLGRQLVEECVKNFLDMIKRPHDKELEMAYLSGMFSTILVQERIASHAEYNPSTKKDQLNTFTQAIKLAIQEKSGYKG